MDSTWFLSWQLQNICFGVLGGLTARHISDGPVTIIGGVIAGLFFSIIASLFVADFLYIANSQVRTQQSFALTWRTVNTGFAMLVPFTVLALLAELALGWNAVQVFTSAGIMAAGIAIGTSLSRLGKQGLVAGLLPSAGAFTLVIAWMILSLLARVLIA
jgi:hypothetical protein